MSYLVKRMLISPLNFSVFLLIIHQVRPADDVEEVFSGEDCQPAATISLMKYHGRFALGICRGLVVPVVGVAGLDPLAFNVHEV